jgi:SAM-dependent methyltransferase
MQIPNLGPLRHPSPPHDEGQARDPNSLPNQSVPILIDVNPELSIEDGIRIGMSEVEARNASITLRLKGIELDIEPQDSFQANFSRYKEHEFNAFAASYERDFIRRNDAMYSVAANTLKQECARYQDPLRMLDVGCGTGFGLRETFAGRVGGGYFGIDPAENMLQVLERTALSLPTIEVSTRQAKGGILRIDSVQDEIINTLGGRPQLITWLAAMHVVNKHEQLGPLIGATAELLDRDGRVVIGNYYHNSADDFEAFRQRYMQTMIHQPTPPCQLFNACQMEAILRTFWLEVISCQEMVCTDGLRAYVMVAKHK